MASSYDNILEEIVANKRQQLAEVMRADGFEDKLRSLMLAVASAPEALDFGAAISKHGINIIAEVKKASPSKGIIREDFDPIAIAKSYEANRAAAISVLTEEKYFMGSNEYLRKIRDAVSIPLLRKDFVIDTYQVYESRALGADALLLIAAILSDEELTAFRSLAESLGMAALVEVHDERELERAVSAGANIIGVNNRDLKNFTTDIDTTIKLLPSMPNNVIKISESGINNLADIRKLKKAGVDAFLIGEALTREDDTGGKLRELVGFTGEAAG
jgi:indole-3-glycerol phosphate synthase